eukprot:scaffold268969_cov32-Tisochrysis_lutea.AAC.2
MKGSHNHVHGSFHRMGSSRESIPADAVRLGDLSPRCMLRPHPAKCHGASTAQRRTITLRRRPQTRIANFIGGELDTRFFTSSAALLLAVLSGTMASNAASTRALNQLRIMAKAITATRGITDATPTAAASPT